MRKLDGKVALVTGGGQGIGLGMAQALADAGANIVITGRNGDKLKKVVADIAASGIEVLTIVADGRQRESARLAIEETIERFGRLDILVNNAQSSVPGTSLVDITDEQIAMTLESGLHATIYFMQAAFPYLKVNGGSVINFGSLEGVTGGKGFAIYAATKEAVRGLSRSAAREWGEYGIRVNVINPAALTPASIAYLEAHPEEAKAYLKNLPLGRLGNPAEDIGPVAVFLASDDSHYITGQTLNADGGQLML